MTGDTNSEGVPARHDRAELRAALGYAADGPRKGLAPTVPASNAHAGRPNGERERSIRRFDTQERRSGDDALVMVGAAIERLERTVADRLASNASALARVEASVRDHIERADQGVRALEEVAAAHAGTMQDLLAWQTSLTSICVDLRNACRQLVELEHRGKPTTAWLPRRQG